jgi:hypothetical protein
MKMMTKTAAILGLVLFLNLYAGAHEHKAPHGGALVELGEEYAHIEVVLEAATGKITGYLLDGEAEKAVRIKQNEIELKISTIEGKDMPITVSLKAMANLLSEEKVGDTSQFGGQSDKLKNTKKFEASVNAVTVKGKEFKDVKFKFPEGNEEKK